MYTLTNQLNVNNFNVNIKENTAYGKHQTVAFQDMEKDWEYSVPSTMDETRTVCDAQDLDLNNFFSRPIKVAVYDWDTSTGSIFQKFNPWNLFFNNPRVVNRISNYNLLRATLKVKILLNGNGFHYGRAICSYIPLQSVDQMTVDRAFFVQDIVAASQRPHIYLDPTKSQGGTMHLPFFWHKNYLSIPEAEWGSMGQCVIHTINDLKHANGATDSVSVSVFVWAEDVQLSVPTVAEPGTITPQAGGKFTDPLPWKDSRYVKQKIERKRKRHWCLDSTHCYDSECPFCEPIEPHAGDEYGSSPISTPAAAVAAIAARLTTAPIIGAYARATEMAASTVAAVAKMFGYSRPAILDPIVPYRPTYCGNLVNTNAPDSTTKLTVDGKQELCSDTRTMGLDGTDEMSIVSIATRESYLTTFDWQVADTEETLLWQSEVNPVKYATLGTPTEYHLTAAAFAALPFRYWRGTMKFRFQVVASAYHKGRLKIVYDPKSTASGEYNTNLTYVLDLASDRDFTVNVGWGVPKPYLETRVLESNTRYGTSPITGFSDNFGNGIISMYVVNELTVPNSTINNDVQINVFVSMGDDFELATPDSLNLKTLTYIKPQAFVEPQAHWYTPDEISPHAGQLDACQADADATPMESAPMQLQSSETLAEPLSLGDKNMLVFFGDPITSFRQMLKRYNVHNFEAEGTNDIHFYEVTTPNFPYYRGYSSTGVDLTDTPAAATPYNYCLMTLLNYVTPAYVGWRGGIRYKLMTNNKDSRGGILYANRVGTRSALLHQRIRTTVTDPSVSVNEARADLDFKQILWNGHSGMHATHASENPCLEYEIPYYANKRFTFAKRNRVENDSSQLYHTYGQYWYTSANNGGVLIRWVATGEDFTLGFYTGPPILYVADSPFPSV